MTYNDSMSKAIDFTNHICFLCGRLCDGQPALGGHLKWTHPETSTHDYVLRFILTDGPPLCGCGCGQRTGWHPRKPWFNDYITGHNPTKGIKRKVRPEDTARRNESIRVTYSEENGQAIKDRISTAVSSAYAADPSYRQKMSDNLTKQWSNPETKAAWSATRKRVWAERHDELYARIFTPEFGRKISEANRKRDLSGTSKAEDRFFQLLSDCGIAFKRRIWIRDEVLGTNKCFDGQLDATGELLEFDGTFWHGLDLMEGDDPYEVQMLNMQNDLHKNALAERLGFGLIRIREDCDMSRVDSVDSLRSAAYLTIESDPTPG